MIVSNQNPDVDLEIDRPICRDRDTDPGGVWKVRNLQPNPYTGSDDHRDQKDKIVIKK